VCVPLRYATTGIFAPLTGIIGPIQTTETLKRLFDIQGGLSGKKLTVNAIDMSIKPKHLAKRSLLHSLCRQAT